jgi:hypothetical protein
LADSLGVTAGDLDVSFHTRKEEFDGLRLSSTKAKEALEQHREMFGVQRLRQDMHIWSENDMLMHAMIARSSIGRQFRKGLIELIKKSAVIEVPTVQENQNLMEQLRLVRADNAIMSERLTALEEVFSWAKPKLQKAASAAGAALSAQRGTKEIRELN